MKKASRTDKALDKRIEQAFYRTCQGVQVNILDIPKVFREGRRLCAEGATDETLDAGIKAYVQTIKAA